MLRPDQISNPGTMSVGVWVRGTSNIKAERLQLHPAPTQLHIRLLHLIFLSHSPSSSTGNAWT